MFVLDNWLLDAVRKNIQSEHQTPRSEFDLKLMVQNGCRICCDHSRLIHPLPPDGNLFMRFPTSNLIISEQPRKTIMILERVIQNKEDVSGV
jgi:hypothetical protein